MQYLQQFALRYDSISRVLIKYCVLQALKRQYTYDMEQLEKSQKLQIEKLEQTQDQKRRELMANVKKEHEKEKYVCNYAICIDIML